MTPELDDPRWRRMNAGPWKCPSCGGFHAGVFDLACGKPDPWPGDDNDKQPNTLVLRSANFLSEDFCVLRAEHYFVRCVLLLPVADTPQKLGLGVWAALLKRDFDVVIRHFDAGDFDGLGPWRGRLANSLKGYPETLNLKCKVTPQSGRQRPLIELEPTDNPLMTDQREGITVDRLLEIYEVNGHDIRAALAT